MKPISCILFVLITLIVCRQMLSAKHREIITPVKKMLAMYRPKVRFPASTSLNKIEINGRSFLIRDDLELSKKSSVKQDSFGKIGSHFVITRAPSADSAIQVLQSETTGKYAALYPRIRVRTNNITETQDALEDLGYTIIRTFIHPGIIIVRLPETKTVPAAIAEVTEISDILRVSASIVEDRIIPR